MIQSLVKQKILDSKQAAWLSQESAERFCKDGNLSESLATVKAEGGDTIECERIVDGQ